MWKLYEIQISVSINKSFIETWLGSLRIIYGKRPWPTKPKISTIWLFMKSLLTLKKMMLLLSRNEYSSWGAEWDPGTRTAGFTNYIKATFCPLCLWVAISQKWPIEVWVWIARRMQDILQRTMCFVPALQLALPTSSITKSLFSATI